MKPRKELVYTIRVLGLAERSHPSELLEKLRETGAAKLVDAWVTTCHPSFGKKLLLGLQFEWTVNPLDEDIGSIKSIKDELEDIYSGGDVMVSVKFSDFEVKKSKAK